MTDTQEAQIIADRAVIEAHGGAKAFARKLKLDEKTGHWRVLKWMQRGIPARVKLAHPGLFRKRRAK